MARQFESLAAFVEWATANGWTVERETWTVEMTQVFVQSPDREWSGSTEEMRLSDYQRRPGAFDREAWKDAWLNWEHERAKSDKE